MVCSLKTYIPFILQLYIRAVIKSANCVVAAADTSQELKVLFTSNIRNLVSFVTLIVDVGTRRAGFSTSDTADLLGFSHTLL